MRSIRFSEFGDPASVLRLEEVPLPEPKPGEVRLRMRVRTVNPSDLYTVAGRYGAVPQLPATPGWEGVGVIEALGEGVSRWQIGQRVLPKNVAGTWQEYLIAPAAQIEAVPANLPDYLAAQMGNPLSAWIIIEQEFKLKPGEWLLQTGASSQFGRVMLQVSRLFGVKTISIVRRTEQIAELKALGADEVIAEDENIFERVMQITEGKGVPAIVEAVGGATAGKVINTVSKNGTVLLFAALSGQPIPLNPGPLIFKTAKMRGFWISDWFRSVPDQERQAVLAKVAEVISNGSVVPTIEATFDLADFAKAIQLTSQGRRQGKVLLVG